jgi:hypothetical protein
VDDRHLTPISLRFPPRTLGDRLPGGAMGLLGRTAEVALIDRLLDPDGAARVLYVHAPGGMGKSALLRAAMHRGEKRGLEPHLLDGRDIAPVAAALQMALEAERLGPQPLVVLDTFERISGMVAYLRSTLLPRLPDTARVVIGSRVPPDRGWLTDGWEHMTIDLPLPSLDEETALALLAREGVDDDRRAREIVDWAGGMPLALVLAAQDRGGGVPAEGERREVIARLVRHIVDSELDGEHPEALAVAGLARVVTPEMMTAVLGADRGPSAYAWLESRTFVEHHAEGLALHDLVRRGIAADVLEREPELDADLRCRLADHLHGRAAGGELRLTRDLSHLLRDPVIRWGYSWPSGERFRVDTLRESDVARVEGCVAQLGYHGWWACTRPLYEQQPGVVLVVRDEHDVAYGVALAVTPDSAPPAADDDPLLGPWLAHARAQEDRRAILWRESIDFSQDPRMRLASMLGVAPVLRSGLDNVRYAYLPLVAGNPSGEAFAAALNARPIPELNGEIAGKPILCHVIDYGPGGLIGRQRDVVYAEAGRVPTAGARWDADTVRAALRDLRSPARLAQSPIASGTSVPERARRARERLDRALERAFGPGVDDALCREVLRRSYWDGATHEQTADAVHLSRASYFRRLREAVDRLAQALEP